MLVMMMIIMMIMMMMIMMWRKVERGAKRAPGVEDKAERRGRLFFLEGETPSTIFHPDNNHGHHGPEQWPTMIIMMTTIIKNMLNEYCSSPSSSWLHSKSSEQLLYSCWDVWTKLLSLFRKTNKWRNYFSGKSPKKNGYFSCTFAIAPLRISPTVKEKKIFQRDQV